MASCGHIKSPHDDHLPVESLTAVLDLLSQLVALLPGPVAFSHICPFVTCGLTHIVSGVGVSCVCLRALVLPWTAAVKRLGFFDIRAILKGG